MGATILGIMKVGVRVSVCGVLTRVRIGAEAGVGVCVGTSLTRAEMGSNQ